MQRCMSGSLRRLASRPSALPVLAHRRCFSGMTDQRELELLRQVRVCLDTNTLAASLVEDESVIANHRVIGTYINVKGMLYAYEVEKSP